MISTNILKRVLTCMGLVALVFLSALEFNSAQAQDVPTKEQALATAQEFV